MDKAHLRKHYIELRRTLRYDDEGVISMLASLLQKPHISSMHIYAASSSLNEVASLPIIRYLQQKYPSVRIIQPHKYRRAPMTTENLDVVIIPVVAFDVRGNRIGMGGGWYDKFLAMHPESIKIGLAYDECEVTKIEPESHDVRLDYVVTPTRLIDTYKLE